MNLQTHIDLIVAAANSRLSTEVEMFLNLFPKGLIAEIAPIKT